MNKLILALVLLYSSSALSSVTLGWYLMPPLKITEWVAMCGPTPNPYNNPISYFHSSQHFEHTMHNLPDGTYRCKVKVLADDVVYPVTESEPFNFSVKNGNLVGSAQALPPGITLK